MLAEPINEPEITDERFEELRSEYYIPHENARHLKGAKGGKSSSSSSSSKSSSSSSKASYSYYSKSSTYYTSSSYKTYASATTYRSPYLMMAMYGRDNVYSYSETFVNLGDGSICGIHEECASDCCEMTPRPEGLEISKDNYTISAGEDSDPLDNFNDLFEIKLCQTFEGKEILCPERIPFNPMIFVIVGSFLCCFCSCFFICKKLDGDEEDGEEEAAAEIEIEVSEQSIPKDYNRVTPEYG